MEVCNGPQTIARMYNCRVRLQNYRAVDVKEVPDDGNATLRNEGRQDGKGGIRQISDLTGLVN